ncbi:TonB-dependent receptor [Nibrella saemangeumensis]|uniref:TonB-dependent receptor n=1 Tax=Nibrella saemangeumensis TaxID=1084526 RepID=A0ABP8N146_9BACT
MNRIFACLIVLLTLSSATRAQSGYILSGIVLDSATNQPLVRAAVVLDYARQTTGAYTDTQGRFEIRVTRGAHVIVVRHIGYLSFRLALSVHRDTDLTVKLPSVSSQLEEVVVTSKGYDRTVREPRLGVSQISMKTLERLPAALGEVDILRGLQLLPGVTSVGEAANGVNIRGGTTDQNLILLDDTPIFNPTHMFGLFSVFPPDAVNGLDLYKGNVPARYGGRAASVLDISLKNPNLEQFRLTGGISLVSNKLTADIPVVPGKVGLLVSGRGAFNSRLLPMVSNQLSSIRADFGDVVAKAFWRISDRSTLTAMGYFSKDFFQTNLLGSLANINSTSTQFRHQTLNSMVRWFYALTPRLNLQATVTQAQYVPDILSREAVTDNMVTLRQALRQRQAKVSLNYQRESDKTEVGISAIHYQLNPGELLPGNSLSVNYQKTPGENALELDLYADHEASISERLAVSAGLRYSHFLSLGPALVRQYTSGEPIDETSVVSTIEYAAGKVTRQYNGLEPRVGVRYSVGANASVKVGYNLMRQYLQVVTNTTTPLPTARWKTSDPHIRPQVSQLWSAGWFQNLKNNVYEWSAEVYWRNTRNVLDYKPGADFLLQANPETQLLQGRSKAYGLEMMLSKKKGELTGWVNYTFARTLNQVVAGADFDQRINGGDWYRANYDRPHSVNASININQSKHHSFSFNFVYSTGRPYTAPEGIIRYQNRNYPYYNERNQYRLPDYHRLDFAWNIYNPGLKARRWQGHWTFTVYNLYGRKNAYSIFFRTEGQATNPYRLAIFAAPIPSLSYNFEFK